MSKKLNVAYAEAQQAGVDKLVKEGSFDKATAHVTFDPKSVQLPEGLTADAFERSMSFARDLTGQVEVGVAQFAAQAYEDNKDITSVDGSLSFGGVSFESSHDLKTVIGDDTLYGSSTSMMVHNYSVDQTAWLEQSRNTLQEQAKKLFS